MEDDDTTNHHKFLKQLKQKRHREWHRINRAEIVASGIPYTDKGECLLFRVRGKKKVDFYPSTGRWKIHSTMSSGGAKKFIEFYNSEGANL